MKARKRMYLLVEKKMKVEKYPSKEEDKCLKISEMSGMQPDGY